MMNLIQTFDFAGGCNVEMFANLRLGFHAFRVFRIQVWVLGGFRN